MMTLYDAIKHAEEVAEKQEKMAKEWHENQVRKCDLFPFADMDYTHENECKECAAEHRQLAEWLKDYKRLMEQEPCDDSISRQAVLKEIPRLWNSSGDKDYCMETLRDFVSELPTVTPERKKAKWVKLYFGSMYDICSECGQRVTTGYFEYNYCPSCGAEMDNEDDSNYRNGKANRL